jgi:hypothetical protein
MGLFSWLFDRFLRRSRDIPGAGPGDKAFLVGINNYPSSPLRGCVNDVHSFKALLLQKYGFKEANVRILLNSNATTKNMTDGLYWLASGAVPGDKRFHHFSGHGTQYPNASEDDGLSEVICPVDFDWSPGKMISDKAYYSIFSSMPKGVVLNWVSDSCHSGDLQRSLSFRARSRFMKPTHEILALLASRRKRIKLARSVTGSFLDVGFVSACRSDQTASDTNIGGTPCGALSWFMVKELRQAASDVPLDKLVESVRRQMSLSAYDQVPQVEGSRSIRPFLMP